MALPALLLLTTVALAQAAELAPRVNGNVQNVDTICPLLMGITRLVASGFESKTNRSDPATTSIRDYILNYISSAIMSEATCTSPGCSGNGDNRPGKREVLTKVEAPIDALIDFAIGFLAHKHALVKGARIPMEDVGNGNLRLINGSLGEMRQLFREDPVILRSMPVDGQEALLISFTAGFRSVDIRYLYEYTLGPLSHSGRVKCSLTPVVVRGDLQLQQPCQLRLVNLDISHIGNFTLDGTGFWPFNGPIFNLLRNVINESVRGSLQNVVGEVRMQMQRQFDAITCS